MKSPEKEMRDSLSSEGRSLPRSADILVEAYGLQVARMRDAASRIEAEGLVVSGPKGEPIPHPAILVEKAASAEVIKLRQAIQRAAQYA